MTADYTLCLVADRGLLAGEALLSSYDRQGGCQGPALRPYEAALFPIN